MTHKLSAAPVAEVGAMVAGLIAFQAWTMSRSLEVMLICMAAFALVAVTLHLLETRLDRARSLRLCADVQATILVFSVGCCLVANSPLAFGAVLAAFAVNTTEILMRRRRRVDPPLALAGALLTGGLFIIALLDWSSGGVGQIPGGFPGAWLGVFVACAMSIVVLAFMAGRPSYSGHPLYVALTILPFGATLWHLDGTFGLLSELTIAAVVAAVVVAVCAYALERRWREPSP
jgi:hypothetical protein